MRFLIIILLSFSAETTSAQDLISVANTFLNDKNYIEAKSAIDEALEQPDMLQNPRAWYTKARVYHEILKSDDENLSDFKAALASFEIAKASKPADTLAYLYSGLSAQNAGMYKEAIEHYTEIKTYTRLTKEVYNGIILSSQSMNASYDQQLEYVEEALFEYPDHIPYVIQEVRLLIKVNRFLEAESILNTSFIRNPNNPLLIIRQADLYDRIFKAAYINGEPERSEQYFEKASRKYEEYIRHYPDDFTANYNYSVMINEQANRVYVRINLMSKDEYQIRGKEVEELGHVWTRKALPYMEKAYQVNPQEEKVILALRVYYERLQMSEKLQALNGSD